MYGLAHVFMPLKYAIVVFSWHTVPGNNLTVCFGYKHTGWYPIHIQFIYTYEGGLIQLLFFLLMYATDLFCTTSEGEKQNWVTM